LLPLENRIVCLFFVIFTPFPTFPQGGRSIENSPSGMDELDFSFIISPLGETGKGVASGMCKMIFEVNNVLRNCQIYY
jgi:hypothetical protein